MFDLPRIRIELEGMKFQIVHAFSSRNEEIEKEVEKQMQKAIDSFPFEDTILKECYGALSSAIAKGIHDYFEYGDGRKAVDEIVSKIFREKP